MIPKIIHYCWFGRSEKPKLALKCIASWKKYCPDYEIIEWNEDNFDCSRYPYASYCLENRKWAYLSDFVRLAVVEKNGGIYFDTDVELIRSLDGLLNHDAFYGWENDSNVATGLGFGAVPHHPTLRAMLDRYVNRAPDENACVELVGCPKLNTEALLPFGLVLDGKKQTVAGAEILPAEYMNPYNDITGVLSKTTNTVSIHWYSKSALSKSKILKSRITRPFHRLFGEHCFDWLKK